MRESLRLLIVDDSAPKRARVNLLLTERLAAIRLEITQAANYEEALSALGEEFFDIAILDLVLPAADGAPSIDTSRALVRYIMQGKLRPPMHIIGLTEYKEAQFAERPFYSDHLLALEYYDPKETDWADRIARRIRYLVRSRDAAIHFQRNSYDLDVVVLTARYENEYVPVKRRLITAVEATSHPIWRSEVTFGTIKLGDGRSLRGAVICVGEMGMAATAAAATEAISIFRPRLVSMLGMCCGFAVEKCPSPRKLMDIVIVREVACWEEGKYVEQSGSQSEFKNRSKVRMVDDNIRERVEELVERSGEVFLPRLRRYAGTKKYLRIRDRFGDSVRKVPEVRFAPLVTGSSVIADEMMVDEILQRHPTAVGLDMEIFGLYTAVERSIGRKPSVLGIKGVADFGRMDKDDFAQEGASVASVEVFKQVLTRLDIFDGR